MDGDGEAIINGDGMDQGRTTEVIASLLETRLLGRFKCTKSFSDGRRLDTVTRRELTKDA
jgi:hypothetical protein